MERVTEEPSGVPPASGKQFGSANRRENNHKGGKKKIHIGEASCRNGVVHGGG